MQTTKTIMLLAALATLLVTGTANGQENKPLFDIQVQRPDAEVGDYVLCPSRQFYDRAVKAGPAKSTFVYYAATLVESNEQHSKVKNLAGRTFTLPNQLVVAIPNEQNANKGDIVLTWWQKGSGMQRAIVVGGTKTEPVVRYLDIKYDNPSGAGKREEALRPNSFYVLTKPWQIGTTVSVEQGRMQRHGQLLALSEDKVLIREFAGKLNCYPRRKAKPVPISPDLQPNAAAQAAVFGSFKPVTVTKIDAEIGRVFAAFQFGRKEREIAFAFGDIF